MELHLYDSNESPLFRILRGEPLWRIFHRALYDSSALPSPDADCEHDLLLTPDQAGTAASTLDMTLQQHLSDAVSQGKKYAGARDPAIGVVTVDVLGERLSLDLRQDEDRTLSRLNDLMITLRNASTSGLSVHVLVVPEWPRIAGEVAWILHNNPEPWTTHDLRSRLLDRLEESRLNSFDTESAQNKAADADFVRQHGLNEALSFLISWRMVTESSPDRVQATDKLRMIVV